MRLGLTGKLGRAWVSVWVVHGCMVAAWVMWCWGFINDVLYYLGLGGLVMVEPDHWGSLGLVGVVLVMSLVSYPSLK